jgi:AraC-like DNA-binding protein
MFSEAICVPFAREASPVSVRAAPWLRRLKEKLRVEFCDRITTDDLAREAGVHPVHLSRASPAKGIGEYVHRLRILEACERMLNPGESLADISS